MKQVATIPLLVIALIGATLGSITAEPYSIPKELTPVSEWADGFTAEEGEHFRNAYTAADFTAGNDVTAYAFLNWSEVVPTMIVGRGNGPVAELKVNLQPALAEVVAKTDLGTMPLAQAIADKRSRLQGIMVVHKGEIAYEKYPGMPPESKHLWASTTKTVSGLLIHLLDQEGLIDLEAPVSNYLEFTKDAPIGAINVEDVLHQRSGLDFEETQANLQNPQHPLGRVLISAVSARGETPAGASAREGLVDTAVSRPPGTAFEYSSLNTQALALIIEKVTGKSWNQVVSERIWTKAGMDGDGLVAITPAGEALATGGYSSTLRDLARYALLFTPSWNVVAESRVVPENYLETVYGAVDPEIYRKGYQGNRMVKSFGEDDAPKGTSYQWDAVFADGDLYKAGLGGQAIYVSPETDTVVVYFSTTWQNSLSMISYARAIVKQKFR